ncbi:MAG: hypothetical protein CSA21_03635 [Deltaproteobacteria bacterium]|nr:MAG: hypothetical protein CSA21_03635 [Deltaproteobacteria bacterium]
MEINTLQDILIIEDDPKILSFRCPDTGYLLWPLLRDRFILLIMGDLLYDKTPIVYEEKSPRPPKAYVSILRACIHNLLKGRHHRSEICISSTGSHVVRDGLYFNRLSDEFALVADDRTITLEALPLDWKWPFPRINGKILFDTSMLAASSLYGKLSCRKRHRIQAISLVDFVTTRTQSLLGWTLSEQRRSFLIEMLSRKIASIPAARFFYSRFFRRIGAKLLLREEGVYGHSSVINQVARENGLITAEYQHGSITAGHNAYNFSKTLCESPEYCRSLPQFLLGYGIWWLDQLHIPSQKIPVGNPYRTEVLKKINMNRGKKEDILVLGDGIETAKYLDLSSFLADTLGESHRIVFRPHPFEREMVARQYGKRFGKVSIEWDKELYDAFVSTDTLVSELSTGLFEAIGLVRSIFLWNTKKAEFCYPEHPLSTFDSPRELVRKIRSGSEGSVSRAIVESFWAPDWERNYNNFLETYGCL